MLSFCRGVSGFDSWGQAFDCLGFRGVPGSDLGRRAVDCWEPLVSGASGPASGVASRSLRGAWYSSRRRCSSAWRRVSSSMKPIVDST